jgi:dipeptidase
MFTIREVDLTDPFTFLGSPNMHAIAKAQGFWDGEGLMDWTKTYSGGEYEHKYYSGRRMWSALRHLVPSMVEQLGNGTYGDLANDKPTDKPWGRSTYPWSVKPDSLVGMRTLATIHRDHYEGTPFSTTHGIAAGPWGSPDRYQTQVQSTVYPQYYPY